MLNIDYYETQKCKKRLYFRAYLKKDAEYIC